MKICIKQVSQIVIYSCIMNSYMIKSLIKKIEEIFYLKINHINGKLTLKLKNQIFFSYEFL